MFIQALYLIKLKNCWHLLGEDWWNWLYPVFGQLVVVHWCFVLVLYTHTCLTIAVIGNFILMLWSHQWRQIKRIQKARAFNVNLKMRLLMRISRRFFVFHAKTNPQIGRNFLVFLLINCPINAVLVISVHFNTYRLLIKILLLTLAFGQIICIIGMHLYFAKSNSALTKPNRPTISLAVKNQHRIRNRTNLCLSLFIQTFHTKRSYGISYWKFGLISFLSFSKVKIL